MDLFVLYHEYILRGQKLPFTNIFLTIGNLNIAGGGGKYPYASPASNTPVIWIAIILGAHLYYVLNQILPSFWTRPMGPDFSMYLAAAKNENT